jgi:hypothetical protein
VIKTLGLLAAFLLAALVLTATLDYTINRASPFSRFDPAVSVGQKPLPVGHTVLSGAMMLLGIFAGAFRASIQGKTQLESVRREFLLTFRSTQFIKSVVAAPIVFSAIYLATKEQPDWVLASIFAFENGFFCDTILRTQEKSHEG